MQVNILGIRGLPAAHGGFESFAAKFAPYMRDRGHDVLVYCQSDDKAGPKHFEDTWEGIHRVHIAPKLGGAVGTMEFDLACVRDVLKRPGVDLVLGYNTALFSGIERLRGRKIAMNMDGIEWKRDKWGIAAKTWFFINEVAGSNICTLPIADHPEIAKHVARRCRKEPVVIPYGGDLIESADVDALHSIGAEPDQYLVSIARIEPENSILEIVQTFSTRKRGIKLVVLGNFDEKNAYHQKVRSAAGEEVIFPGAIYDPETVQAIRFYARAYMHGHTVGGTNPSLVEALGAGNAVIAHDNRFNRWVAGEGHRYFSGEAELDGIIQEAADGNAWLAGAREAARRRHDEAFRWDDILGQYERVLLDLAEQG